MFGLFFIYLVHRRDKSFKYGKATRDSENSETCCGSSCACSKSCNNGLCLRDVNLRRDFGVPTQYGVFYALGISLAMEGALSSAYHLCPNQSTFQFGKLNRQKIKLGKYAFLIFQKFLIFRHMFHVCDERTDPIQNL